VDLSQNQLLPVVEAPPAATRVDDGWWLDEETVLAQFHCQPPCQGLAAYNLAGELRWELVNEAVAAEATGPGKAPMALSPNRRALFYLQAGAVESVDTESGVRTVIWQAAGGEQPAGPFYLSPDGLYLNFRVVGGETNALQLIGSDGDDYGRRENSTFLDWRPGGGLVVSQAVEGSQNQLVYWPLDGPAARIFVRPTDFAFPTGRWSPDGRSFVYSALDEAIGASYLYWWRPEGGLAALIHATASTEPFDNFTWVADSESFYFSLDGVALWHYQLEPALLTLVAAPANAGSEQP
jgi:hypothetical protein